MIEYAIPVIVLLAMSSKMGISDPELNQEIGAFRTALQGGENQSILSKHIHHILTGVWTKTWKRSTSTVIVDPTERYLALATLKKDSSFKEPKHVTTIIAKLEYCMRLTFLRELRSKVDVEGGMEEHEACDALQDWFIENKSSTFSRLRSLQHRASAIAFDTMSLPNIWWTDSVNWKSMLFKGEAIHFDDVCGMFVDTEARLIELWEQKALGGLSLRAEHGSIADDLTNKNVGYSFMTDSRNKAFKYRGQLIQAAIQGDGGFKHFANVANGKIEWNKGALRTWLQSYAELHSLFLLRAEMLSGAPSRGTELTALTYRNTKTRPTRSLVMLGKHLTILCRYAKTTALTGQDRLIPHALDGITSDLMIQDLALARPFAEIAARACFSNKPEIKELYRNQLFINFNRLFTTEDLSGVMTRYSLPRLNYALTVNPWRHIQTAWKRKFRCSSDALRGDDTTNDLEALQAGHTRATEDRIYGLSMYSLAGVPEDVLPYYLEASTSWQTHCRTVMGGTLLPYQQARAASLDPTHTFRNACAPPSTTNLVLPIQDIAEQVVALLTPRLSGLIQDAVTKALIVRSLSQTSIPSNKGKGKAVQRPPENAWEEDDDKETRPPSSDEDDVGLRLALQQEAEMIATKRFANNQGEGAFPFNGRVTLNITDSPPLQDHQT